MSRTAALGRITKTMRDAYLRERGVKLLGVAVRTDKGIEQRVHPTMVPKDSAIAQVIACATSEALVRKRSKCS